MPGEADGPSLLNRRSAESMAKNAGKLIELFSVFDPESSGTVAMADFALILKAVAVPTGARTVMRLTAECQNHDGRVMYRQFMSLAGSLPQQTPTKRTSTTPLRGTLTPFPKNVPSTPASSDMSPTVLTPPNRRFSPGDSLLHSKSRAQGQGLAQSQGSTGGAPVSTAGIIAMELCALLCEPGAIESLGNGIAPLEETVGASAALLAQYLGHRGHLEQEGATPAGVKQVRQEAAEREMLHQAELKELSQLREKMDEQLRLASEALIDSQCQLQAAQGSEASSQQEALAARRESERLQRELIACKTEATKAKTTAEHEVECLRHELSQSASEVARLERQLLEAAKAGAQANKALRNLESKESSLAERSSEREQCLRDELSQLRESESAARSSHQASLERAHQKATQASARNLELELHKVEVEATLAEERRRATASAAELVSERGKVQKLQKDLTESARREADTQALLGKAQLAKEESELALEEAEAVVSHLAQRMKAAQQDALEARQEAVAALATVEQEREAKNAAVVAAVEKGEDIAMGARLEMAEATQGKLVALVVRSWRAWGALVARVMAWSHGRLTAGFWAWRGSRESHQAGKQEAREEVVRAQTRADAAMAHIAILENQLATKDVFAKRRSQIVKSQPQPAKASLNPKVAPRAVSSAEPIKTSINDPVWDVLDSVPAMVRVEEEVPWHLAFGSPTTADTVGQADSVDVKSEVAFPLDTSQGLQSMGIQHYRERATMQYWLLEVTTLKAWRVWALDRRHAKRRFGLQHISLRQTSAMRYWRQWASRRRKAKRAMRKACSHRAAQPFSIVRPRRKAMLQAWRTHTSSCRRWKRLCKKSLTHEARRAQAISLQAWRGLNLTAMRGAHFIAQARCVLEEKRLKAGLKGWQQIAQGSAETTVRASLALVWRRRRLFHTTLKRWQIDNRRSKFKKAKEERRIATAREHSQSKQGQVIRAGWDAWRGWYHHETKLAFLAQREKEFPATASLEEVMARAMQEAQETKLRLRMPDGTIKSLSPSQSVEPVKARPVIAQPSAEMGANDTETHVMQSPTAIPAREETLEEAIASTIIDSISPRARDSSVSLSPAQVSPSMEHNSMDQALSELEEVMEEGMLLMSESPVHDGTAKQLAAVVLTAGVNSCVIRIAVRTQLRGIEQSASARLGALIRGHLSRCWVAAECDETDSVVAQPVVSPGESLVRDVSPLEISDSISIARSLSPSHEVANKMRSISSRSTSRERKRYVQKSIKVADEALLQRQQWLDMKGKPKTITAGKRVQGRPKSRALQDLTNAAGLD